MPKVNGYINICLTHSNPWEVAGSYVPSGTEKCSEARKAHGTRSKVTKEHDAIAPDIPSMHSNISHQNLSFDDGYHVTMHPMSMQPCTRTEPCSILLQHSCIQVSRHTGDGAGDASHCPCRSHAPRPNACPTCVLCLHAAIQVLYFGIQVFRFASIHRRMLTAHGPPPAARAPWRPRAALYAAPAALRVHMNTWIPQYPKP
jgi:hypothetical protein